MLKKSSKVKYFDTQHVKQGFKLFFLTSNLFNQVSQVHN